MAAHLIVHKQTIGSQDYIRIVSTNNIASYRAEQINIYNDLENMHIFYNCSTELHERLLIDIGFKRFKTVELTKINDKLWSVKAPEMWFSNVYIAWIQKKLESYVEDLEDAEAPAPEAQEAHEPLEPARVSYYHNFKDFVTNSAMICKESFKLENCDICNDKIVLTLDHFMQMLYFFKINSFNIKETTPIKIIAFPQVIQGYCIEKDELNSNEIAYILSRFNITKFDTLIKYANFEIEGYDYCKQYYFVDETYNNYNIIDDYFTPNSSCKEAPEIVPATIYKNTLNNKIVVFQEPLLYLSEFVKLAESSNPTMIRVINNIDITRELIEEFKKFISIIEAEQAPECKQDPPTELLDQRTLTQLYVDKYKNDKLQTLASVVIDNITQYLVDYKCPTINKNKIGTDLLEMGVKKTRKNIGYVYGIATPNPFLESIATPNPFLERMKDLSLL